MAWRGGQRGAERGYCEFFKFVFGADNGNPAIDVFCVLEQDFG